MSTFDLQTVQLVFVAVAALALALQTIFLIVAVFIARGAIRSLRKELEYYRESVTPIIDKTREVTENIAPKIQEAAGELNNIVKTLQQQTADIRMAADDIVDRTRHQVNRVDGMLTAVFDRVERAGVFMSDAVAKPMRQFSGVIASIKAVIEKLRESQAGQPQQSRSSYAAQPPRQAAEPEPMQEPEADEELYR